MTKESLVTLEIKKKVTKSYDRISTKKKNFFLLNYFVTLVSNFDRKVTKNNLVVLDTNWVWQRGKSKIDFVG